MKTTAISNKRIVSVFILFCIFTLLPAYGDSDSSVEAEYEPYAEHEFPGWARKIRRAEILFFGSIPITFLFSAIVHDLYRYTSNDFSLDYAPALFSGGGGTALSSGDKKQRIIIAVSLSTLISLTDYLLGLGRTESAAGGTNR